MEQYWLTLEDEFDDYCTDQFSVVSDNGYKYVAEKLASLFYYENDGWESFKGNGSVNFTLWRLQEGNHISVAKYKIELDWSPEFCAWRIDD